MTAYIVHEMAAAYIILGGLFLVIGALKNKGAWWSAGWALIILATLLGSE